MHLYKIICASWLRQLAMYIVMAITVWYLQCFSQQKHMYLWLSFNSLTIITYLYVVASLVIPFHPLVAFFLLSNFICKQFLINIIYFVINFQYLLFNFSSIFSLDILACFYLHILETINLVYLARLYNRSIYILPQYEEGPMWACNHIPTLRLKFVVKIIHSSQHALTLYYNLMYSENSSKFYY